MYEEDKTVLSPREEPEKPEVPELPENPVMPTPEDATVVSDIPVIPEIPEIPEVPASEDATVVSDEPIAFDIPVMDEAPATPEIPVMENIPADEVNAEGTSGRMEDSSKDWMAIVAIITGVLSLCGSVFAPLGCLFSIAAVVLGVLGMKSTKRTLAIVGLIAGGLGILLSLVFGGLWIVELFVLDGGYF